MSIARKCRRKNQPSVKHKVYSRARDVMQFLSTAGRDASYYGELLSWGEKSLSPRLFKSGCNSR